MDFYDFHVHSAFSEGESTIEEIAIRAKLLGFKGICFEEYFYKEEDVLELKKEAQDASKKIGIDIFIGLEARSSKDLKKLIKLRKLYDVLLVRGFDIKLNRRAVETPEVNILTHPESERKDSGFDHVMAKLAAKNDVAIEINFREILNSSKKTRSHIIQKMSKNIMLCKKYKTPIIICSGSISHWHLRDPKILASIGCLIGLDLNEAKECLSSVPARMIKMIKERQKKEWVMPGVKVTK